MAAIGFIGVGNMSSALLRGMCSQANPSDILAFDRHPERLDALAGELGFATAQNASEVARNSAFVVLGVQPFAIEPLLDEIAPALHEANEGGSRTILCSIAAGYGLADFKNWLSLHMLDMPVVRIMPNSGVGIGKGVCLFAASDDMPTEAMERLMKLFAGTGLCECVAEDTLEIATPIYACSPAYVYIFIESLADAGVQLGLERGLAMRLAKQAVYGTAAYAIESDKHVAQLREELATPRGMTITSTNYMEQLGFRAAVIGGALKAYEHTANVK